MSSTVGPANTGFLSLQVASISRRLQHMFPIYLLRRLLSLQFLSRWPLLLPWISDINLLRAGAVENMKNKHYSMLRIVLSFNFQDQVKLRMTWFFFPEVSSLRKLMRFSCNRLLLGLPSFLPAVPHTYPYFCPDSNCSHYATLYCKPSEVHV